MLVESVTLLVSTPVLVATGLRIHGTTVPQSRFANSRLLWFLEFSSRWFLGILMFTGGMSKLMPFPGIMGPVWLEEALAPHGLAIYARFIAFSEAIIGASMFFRRTRVLGTIMMVPLLLNIWMVTISLSWRGTPWVVGFFLVLNAYLMVYYLQHWKNVWRQPLPDAALPCPDVKSAESSY